MKIDVRALLARLGLLQPAKLMYIGGSDVLPPPLKPAEEQALLKRLSDGDEAARQTLIERNLRLVVYIARRFENTGIHIEDLISIGTIGLIKGVSTFDPSKNVRLATYISRCIENPIHSPMRLFLLIGRLFPNFLKHNTYYAAQANVVCGMHLYVFTASLSLHLES